MLLLTLFLTATVLAFRDREDGNHGDNQCTQDLGTDLRCLLQPFTGPIDGCADSLSATSTTCSLRVDREWPHADAVGDVSLRRLLGGRGGRTNIARIDVTEQALSEVVLRSGRRRNPDYTCMGSSSTLTISSVVVHDLAGEIEGEGQTEGADIDGESAGDNSEGESAGDNTEGESAGENAEGGSASDNAVEGDAVAEGEITETEGEGDNPDAEGDFERTDGALERTFEGENTGAEGEEETDGPRDDFEGEEVDAENSEGAEGEHTEGESGEAESAGEDAESARDDFEGDEGEGDAVRDDFEGGEGESDSDSFEGGEGVRDFEGRRALDAEESESPYATITLTQTNTDAEGNVVSFDLTMNCRVAYRRNGCSVRGLLCQDGEYTFLAGSDDGSTEEITENFRMTCRDPTQLEEGQTFPFNWNVDACNEN